MTIRFILPTMLVLCCAARAASAQDGRDASQAAPAPTDAVAVAVAPDDLPLPMLESRPLAAAATAPLAALVPPVRQEPPPARMSPGARLAAGMLGGTAAAFSGWLLAAGPASLLVTMPLLAATAAVAIMQ
jgi:hypothetical protein